MRGRVLLFLLVAAPNTAQAHTLDETAGKLKDLAARAETWIPFLQAREQLVSNITLGLIVLGALATLAALAQNTKAKWITAAITALMTTLVGVKSQVLRADQESFGSLEIATAKWVQGTKDDVANYEKARAFSQADEEAEYGGKFTSRITEFDKIDARAEKLNITLSVARQHAALELPGETAVFAAGLPQSAPAPPGNSYVAIGKGICSSTSGAGEYARFDGRRRIASEISPGATPEELDALIMAVDESSVDQWDHLTTDLDRHLATHLTQVTLNKVLAQPIFLKPRVESRPKPQFSASAALRPGRVEVGIPQHAKGLEGAFVFALEVTAQPGGFAVRLGEIRTYDDGGAGTTRWSFDVVVGGNRLFAVPLRRLEDSGKPTTCQTLPDEHLLGTVKATGSAPLELKVLGYRP